MTNLILALGAYVLLFTLLWCSVLIGYNLGKRNLPALISNQPGIVKVAEATVFALLGLLVAFSFSGAYNRFEERKFKIIDEINLIRTAYHRIDLLKPTLQPDMRDLFKQYLDERIITYHRLAEFSGFGEELQRFAQMQQQVWDKSVIAVHITGDHATTLLFIPAINNMIKIADTRIMMTRIHPPGQIFLLLIGLAALSSFLAGYNMAKNQMYSLVYTLCFVAIMAFTLYVIIDLEFPRIGLIRLDAFDHFLIDLRKDLMK